MAWPHEEVTVIDKWREVHFRYGLAAQKAVELETDLLLLLVDLDMKTEGKYRFEDSLNFISHYAQNVRVLGRLIGALKQKIEIPEADDFGEQLATALKKRNYLVHHFYRVRAESFESPAGCDAMIEELVDIRDHLEIAVGSLHEVTERLIGPKLQLENILSFIDAHGQKFGLATKTFMANYEALASKVPAQIDQAFREKKSGGPGRC